MTEQTMGARYIETNAINEAKIQTLEKRIDKYLLIAWGFVILGFVIALIGLCKIFPDKFEYEKFGTFAGGAVTALWSLGGLFFIYVSFMGQQQQLLSQQVELALNRYELELTRVELVGQKNELIEQNAQSKQQRFEDTLFKMFQANRTIIADMEYEVPDEHKGERNSPSFENIVVRGQKVMVAIQKQINAATEECSTIFSEYNIHHNYFKDDEAKEKQVAVLQTYYQENYSDKLLLQIQQINIIYQSIFIGLDKNGIVVLRRKLETVYNNHLIDDVLKCLSSKPVCWSTHVGTYNFIKKGKFQGL